jgi:GNAT superfamily N-acetyltransferase
MQGLIIRKATADDLADVRRWLEREEHETGEGFFCNMEIIEAIHKEGMLDVFVIESETVAFVADGWNGPNIVEVRPEFRGRGLGRQAAEHALQRAFDRGNAVVQIQCAPYASIHFWQKMGFRLLVSEDGLHTSNHAYKKLSRKLDMPKGESVPFKIQLYPTQRAWKEDVEALDEIIGTGTKVEQTVHLPERAVFFNPQSHSQDRSHISVSLGDEPIFEGYIDTIEAHILGVQRDHGNNYYLDKIMRL